ncbi:MAG TPA: sialate O-acetylesterase [Chthonomonadaceae bacterium]|nr:sialate O-acetylesterase [Chthonomonadaceae bacterium]
MLPLPARAVAPNGLFTSDAVLQRDQPIPVWGSGAEGERVAVTLRDRTVAAIVKGGRWSVRLPPMPAGGPYTLTIRGRNRVTLSRVYVGEVYLCGGQSNMEWPVALAANAVDTVAAARDPLLHLYIVPRGASDTPATDVAGGWQQCAPESVRGFSAVAYAFGASLRKALGVPVGLIQCAWSATPAQAWTSREALLASPELAPIVGAYESDKAEYWRKVEAIDAARARLEPDANGLPRSGQPGPGIPREPPSPTNQSSPGTLFNAMVAPLAPYGIRGVIWYQGESDAGAAARYAALFPTLIESWRKLWKQGDFPFLFVQIAPFLSRREEPEDSALAELREAQRLTSLRVPNTGMAVITDAGDETDLHPRDKRTVGERLALLARMLVYGQPIEGSGPVLESAAPSVGEVRLRFSHTGGGLIARGDRLEGFTIAGEDGKFVPASAAIRGDTIVVSSPEVPHPAGVRYGWADYPEGNLWNRAGLPASPFRTDSFPLTTEQRRNASN